MLVLYGLTFTRAYRVIWLMEEMGLDYQQRDGARHPLGQRAIPTDELLALNPLGKVPVLVDGDAVMTESHAINLYLVRKYGGPLAPVDIAGWGQLYRWSLWLASELEPMITQRFELRFVGIENASDRALKRDVYLGREISNRLAQLNAWLEMRACILGAEFSVADINVAGVLEFSTLADIKLESFTAICQWRDEQCRTRPIWQNLRRRIGESSHAAGHT